MTATAIYRDRPGRWGPTLTKVVDALCEDGRRRTARVTGEADTFFSVPASVKVAGKSVSGFITGRESEENQQDYEFIAYSYGKNGHLLDTGKGTEQ